MVALAITCALFGLLAAARAAAPPCGDAHAGCGAWADGGECQKNEAFMKESCAEACGFCTPPPMLEASDDPLLGPERVVLQIKYGDDDKYGDIVLGFYPSVAVYCEWRPNPARHDGRTWRRAHLPISCGPVSVEHFCGLARLALR